MTRDDILQDPSPVRAAQALDANKIAFGTLLSTQPHAILHNELGLLWFETGVASSVFNGVLQIRLEPEQLPAAIERVLTHFRQRNLPFDWYLGPSSQTDNIGDLLEANGMSHNEDEPGMAADLHTLNADQTEASNLMIQPVLTENQVHQWSSTTYCGAPENEIHNVFTVYSGLLRGPQSPLHLYLGTIDDEPIATTALFFAAGVAYIGCVVTVHAFRRRGIGAMMTLHTMHEARRAGYRIAVLNASSMGINIYRSLGFKECCLTSSYEWYPTSN